MKIFQTNLFLCKLKLSLGRFKFSRQHLLLSQSAATEKSNDTINPPLISIKECKRFITDCFSLVNVPKKNGIQLAELLVEADRRGVFSEGIYRLEWYINEFISKSIDGKAVPKIIKETPASAWIDGCNSIGVLTGNLCMKLAIEKAKCFGACFTCAKNSNNFGMAAYYSLQAMNSGLLGIAMTNSEPYLIPTRGKEPKLGSNTISVAIKTDLENFVFDTALTPISVNKLEMLIRMKEKIYPGLAYTKNLTVTDDPVTALKDGFFPPLGGSEATGGYKGYNIAAIIEILCGVLTGAKYSNQVRKYNDPKIEPLNIGHAFIVIDPIVFNPSYKENINEFIQMLRKSSPLDPSKPVIIPGDIELEHSKKVDKAGGIQYSPDHIDMINRITERLEANPIQYV